MRVNVRTPGTGSGCLLLFALPFAAIGIGMSALAFATLWEAHRLADWVEVPARVEQAELQTSRGDDSTTYRATATYAYEWQGRTYRGTRVSLHGGSDNIGSFHQRTASWLADSQRNGEAVPCYIDPTDAAKSILIRTPRIEMLLFQFAFGFIFGSVGFGLLGSGVWQHRKSRRVTAHAAQFPDEPWRWNADWASGTVPSGDSATLLALAAITIFWNSIAVPAAVLALQKAPETGFFSPVLLVLLFPLIGLGLLAATVRTVLQRRKYGRCLFNMAAVPGVIGGPLCGAITVPTAVEGADAFTLRLTCQKRVTTRSGGKSRTSTHTLWQEERRVRPLEHGRHAAVTTLPVLFAVPYDAEPTTTATAQDRERITWRLEASASVPGVDFHTQFDVPVFRTAASRNDFVPDETPIAPFLADPTPEETWRQAGLQVEERHRSLQVYVPPARLKGPALATTGFALIWNGIVVVLFVSPAPFMLAAIFALFGLLLLFGMLSLWLSAVRITVEPGALTVRGGWLAAGRERRYAAADIANVEARGGMTMGSTLYYHVALLQGGGRAVSLTPALASRQAADALARRLAEALEIGQEH